MKLEGLFVLDGMLFYILIPLLILFDILVNLFKVYILTKVIVKLLYNYIEGNFPVNIDVNIPELRSRTD